VQPTATGIRAMAKTAEMGPRIELRGVMTERHRPPCPRKQESQKGPNEAPYSGNQRGLTKAASDGALLPYLP
jgi:hypothetical protein